MAKRDVQLVIRAKDEASRALVQISDLLASLDLNQKGATASGKSLGTSIAETIVQMAKMERVTGLVVAASERAENAINGQRNAIKNTAAELNAVTRQLAAGQQAINSAQTAVVNNRLDGGDGKQQVAALIAARAASADLESQQGKLTRTLAAQESVLAAQESEFRQLASSANTAEAALNSFGDEAARGSLKAAVASEQASAALAKQAAAEDELARARAASAQTYFNNLNGVSADPRGEQAEASAAVFAEAADRQAQAVQNLRNRIDPLAAVERRLATETKLLSKAFDEGALDAAQYQRALDLLQKEAQNSRDALDRVGRGAKGQIGLFGLKPYELTNLGYQANDLVTQIASGTPIFQAFAQQGGQILQLLPNIGAKIQAIFTNPYILASAAAVGVFTIAMKEAGDQADRLRKIEGIVESAGRGADVTAEALVDVARQIERIGFSADEAVGLVRTFLVEGLNTNYLVQFAAAAEDLATVTGKELPDAIKVQTDAFTAGYDAVAALDDAEQFLTVAERDLLRAMFESGDAAGARAKAFALYEKDIDRQADKSRGTWASAVKSLDKAFSDLLETLGSTDFAQNFVTN